MKAIIFDWSGTLADNNDHFYYCVGQVFKSQGLQVPSFEEVRDEFTIPYMDFYHKYMPELSKADQDRMFREAVPDAPDYKVFPKVPSTLAKLKDKGVELFIVSSDPEKTLKSHLGKLERFFTQVHCDIHDKTEVVKGIKESFGYESHEIVFVGDTAGEIMCARKAGVMAASSTQGVNSRKVLQAAKPDYLINSISELLDIAL